MSTRNSVSLVCNCALDEEEEEMDATKTKGFCILDYGEDVIIALPPWNDDSSGGT